MEITNLDVIEYSESLIPVAGSSCWWWQVFYRYHQSRDAMMCAVDGCHRTMARIRAAKDLLSTDERVEGYKRDL